MEKSKEIIGGLIFGFFFTAGMLYLFISMRVESKPLEEKLQTFYEAEFDSCLIIEVYRVENCKGIRGEARFFQVNCYEERFPVLIENYTKKKYNAFKAGSTILKESNSRNIKIYGENGKISTTIWEIKYDKAYLIILAGIAIGGFAVVVLFIKILILKLKN